MIELQLAIVNQSASGGEERHHMSVSVRLQVEGVDLAQEATHEAIATSDLSAALWSRVDGIQTVTVFPETDDVTSDVLRFARLLTSRVPGARVLRVHRDLVSMSDIAHRTGFSREAVRKWATAKVGRSFPTPYGSVGEETRTSKIWLWPDVAEWLTENYEFSVDIDWPDEVTVAHIEACLQRVPDFATPEWRPVGAPSLDMDTADNPLRPTCRRVSSSRAPTVKLSIVNAYPEHGEVVGA